MSAKFEVYEALGNRYLVAELGELVTRHAMGESCRLFSADGVLCGRVTGNGRIELRIFNADGSEAETSGNGTRIFAKFLCSRGLGSGKSYALRLGGRTVHCAVNEKRGEVLGNLGAYSIDSEIIRIADRCGVVPGRRVCLGNPHFVVAVEKFPRNWLQMAETMSEHETFPRHCNVEFMVLQKDALEIRIFERGVGETLSCGSGAAACAAIAREIHGYRRLIPVRMRGGTLGVAIWRGRAIIAGPVKKLGAIEGTADPGKLGRQIRLA